MCWLWVCERGAKTFQVKKKGLRQVQEGGTDRACLAQQRASLDRAGGAEILRNIVFHRI